MCTNKVVVFECLGSQDLEYFSSCARGFCNIIIELHYDVIFIAWIQIIVICCIKICFYLFMMCSHDAFMLKPSQVIIILI